MRIGISSAFAASFMMFVDGGLAAGQEYETVAVLSGIARVRDGDGVLFGDVEVRLQGIAAPEDSPANREPGGPESTANLRALVEGKFLVCHLDGTTGGSRYRPVGICYLGDLDIGRHQVATGHARDCPRFSGGRYADAEEAATRASHDLGAIYALPAYCGQR